MLSSSSSSFVSSSLTSSSSSSHSNSLNYSNSCSSNCYLLITIGPQCSGKTTYLSKYKQQQQQVEENQQQQQQQQQDNNNNVVDIAMDNIDRTYEKITINSIIEYQENGLIKQEWNRNVYRQTMSTRINELNGNEQLPLLLLFTENVTLEEFNTHIMELIGNNQLNNEDGETICEVANKLYNDGYRMESQTIDIYIRDAMGYSVQQAQLQLEEACKNPSNKYVSWGNTNLSPNMYKTALQIASETQRKVRFIKWGYELPSVPLQELQIRNTLRYLKTGRYVTHSVVKDFFRRVNNFITPPELFSSSFDINSSFSSNNSLFEISKKYDETLVNLAGFEMSNDGLVSKSFSNQTEDNKQNKNKMSFNRGNGNDNNNNRNNNNNNNNNNYQNVRYQNQKGNMEKRIESFGNGNNNNNNNNWRKVDQSKEQTEYRQWNRERNEKEENNNKGIITNDFKNYKEKRNNNNIRDDSKYNRRNVPPN